MGKQDMYACSENRNHQPDPVKLAFYQPLKITNTTPRVSLQTHFFSRLRSSPCSSWRRGGVRGKHLKGDAPPGRGFLFQKLSDTGYRLLADADSGEH